MGEDYKAGPSCPQYRADHDQRHFGRTPRVTQPVHYGIGSSAPRPSSGRFSPLGRLEDTDHEGDASSSGADTPEESSEEKDLWAEVTDVNANADVIISPNEVKNPPPRKEDHESSKENLPTADAKKVTSNGELSEILKRVELKAEAMVKEAELERCLRHFRPFVHLAGTIGKSPPDKNEEEIRGLTTESEPPSGEAQKEGKESLSDKEDWRAAVDDAWYSMTEEIS